MQKLSRYFLKSLLRGIVISFVIAFIVIFLEIIYGRKLVINQDFFIEIAYYCLYCVTLTIVNGLFFDYVNHEARWDKRKKFRIAIGISGSIVLTIIGIFLVRLFIAVFLENKYVATFLGGEEPKNYVISTLIAMVVSMFFHMIHFYKKSQENKVKEQKIIAGTASAKFESLKNQIDPHFLFNSLNVLSSLIEEDPDNAQRFTSSLSKVYRYVLEQKDKELVSVEEELSFAKTYMNLLKMRFENSVSYEVQDVISNPEAKVVPLSLQLLLENTVKHNSASETKPLRIKIYENEDYLVIENEYQKKEVLQDRQGVGLQNIISRYAIITNRKVTIEQTDAYFRVAIPMLTKQIAIMETNYKDEQNIYLKAQKRVEDIKGFYGNLTMYILVITGLAILNLVTYPQFLWFFYPMAGWGIGVIIHAIAVFNFIPFFGRDWEEKKINELMQKDSSDKWH